MEPAIIQGITQRVTKSHSSRREYKREAEFLAESFDLGPSLGDQSTPRGFRGFQWAYEERCTASDMIKSPYGSHQENWKNILRWLKCRT